MMMDEEDEEEEEEEEEKEEEEDEEEEEGDQSETCFGGKCGAEEEVRKWRALRRQRRSNIEREPERNASRRRDKMMT